MRTRWLSSGFPCFFRDNGTEPATLRADPVRGLSANRERLAWGPGGGNEHPWSAHGGAETPARMPTAPDSNRPSWAWRSFRSARVVQPSIAGHRRPSSRGPDDVLGCLATDSAGVGSSPKGSCAARQADPPDGSEPVVVLGGRGRRRHFRRRASPRKSAAVTQHLVKAAQQ